MERTRSNPTPATNTPPVTFPESYPFSLLSELLKRPASPPTGPPEVQDLYNPGLGETATVFLVLGLSASKKLFSSFLEGILEIEGKDKLSALLSLLFKVGTSIISNDAFPDNWLNVNVLAHKVLIKILDPIATFLERDYVPKEQADLDVNLWRGAFTLLLKLLSSQHLTIEEFTPQVRGLSFGYVFSSNQQYVETKSSMAPCW